MGHVPAPALVAFLFLTFGEMKSFHVVTYCRAQPGGRGSAAPRCPPPSPQSSAPTQQGDQHLRTQLRLTTFSHYSGFSATFNYILLGKPVCPSQCMCQQTWGGLVEKGFSGVKKKKTFLKAKGYIPAWRWGWASARALHSGSICGTLSSHQKMRSSFQVAPDSGEEDTKIQ